MDHDRRHYPIALLFILPQLVVIGLFFLWPAWCAIKASLFYSDAFGLQERFAGLGNFLDLIHRADYMSALGVTGFLALSITILTMVLGLVVALLVYGRGTKSQAVYRSLFLWPYAVAPAVAAILWRFLCHPTLGWLTEGLGRLGVTFNDLIHPKQALFVVILAASWQQLSYNFLFYFSALALIPKAYMEAALLDGASPWKRFWQITFPLLSPTTLFLLMTNLIYACFDTFGIIQILTNGGPGHSTTTLIYQAYKDGFIGMDPGSSSAQSIILMLIVVILAYLQYRFLGKRVHY